MRFLLSLILCCFVFSCQKDFSGLENAPSIPTYLNGEWELVAQEKDGVLERLALNDCGTREKIRLAFSSTNEIYDSDQAFFDKEQLIGQGNYEWCGVNPSTYQVELMSNSCYTRYHINPDNPTQWTSYCEGPCLYYLASWQKNRLTLQVKDNIHERGYIPEGITKLIYRKL